MNVKYKNFTVDGTVYTLIELTNTSNMRLTLTSCGAGIREIKVPDKFGNVKTVTLAPKDDSKYQSAYHGKTIGRTAGRIENATFSIDGKVARLQKNNFDTDNLHGGEGVYAKPFDYTVKQREEYTDVSFTYFSPDGEHGYFGNVTITVTYRVYEKENKFRIFFDGETDRKTLLNLTNHVYLNVSGDLSEKVTEQTMYLNASRYGEVNERLIVRKIAEVSDEFNFTTPRKIGERIEDASVQRYTKGYDHVFFLNESGLHTLACSLSSQKSGILLEVRTTYPCAVVYTNNFPLELSEVGAEKQDEKYLAVCFECQYHPDGIHQMSENCGVFTPEKGYHEETEFTFKTIN
ncbi:MAG: galactose mutarotase [Clostridia bacterium]|nr:galactose mutarotase [Clostridia bacterium]